MAAVKWVAEAVRFGRPLVAEQGSNRGEPIAHPGRRKWRPLGPLVGLARPLGVQASTLVRALPRCPHPGQRLFHASTSEDINRSCCVLGCAPTERESSNEMRATGGRPKAAAEP